MPIFKEVGHPVKKIYKKFYNFDLGNDLTPFNLVLSTDDLDPDQVFHGVRLVIDRLVIKT